MIEYWHYLILAASGLIVTLYKIFKVISEGKEISMSSITSKILLSFIISLLVTPKVIIYFSWSIETALAANSIINLFSEGIMKIVEKKVYKKIENNLNNF